MKKLLKITAFVIMIVSLFTLSASAQNKTIQWNDGYDIETYSYGGELKLGNNKIAPVGEKNWFDSASFHFNNVYYEFDVEKSGYYSVETVGELYVTPFVSQDIRDGVVYGDKETMFYDYDGFEIYLEEGECVFGVNFIIYGCVYPDDIYNCKLNIEFVAEEITDISVEDEYLEDIILGYHIATEYDENNIGSVPAKGKVIFNNGKELEFDQYISVEYPDNIAPGKNKISFVFPNFKKDYTVQIKTVKDYIKAVEIGNPEEVAVVKQLFISDVIYTPDAYFELILTKPDGTKIAEEIYYSYDLELKGDKYLTIWCNHYQKDDGNWYLTVEVGNEEYLSIPCETIPASFGENYILYTDYITESILNIFTDFSWYMFDAVNAFSGLSITERAESFSDAFISVGENCSEIYKLTEMFINYIR